MNQELLEKHEALVIEIAGMYLDNMELELGKKYKKPSMLINASISSNQVTDLQEKYKISSDEFAEVYTEFQDMEPTSHLEKTLEAFSASGGGIDIEPSYDESTQRLVVAISFAIKEKTFETLEGLTPLENIFLKMNAMLQLEKALGNAGPGNTPAF